MTHLVFKAWTTPRHMEDAPLVVHSVYSFAVLKHVSKRRLDSLRSFWSISGAHSCHGSFTQNHVQNLNGSLQDCLQKNMEQLLLFPV